MIGSRVAVRFAHYDGLGAHEVADGLRALETEAGWPSDLGWISEALADPTFVLVTMARNGRLRGYAAGGRGATVRLDRLVVAADPELARPQLGGALVDALLRLAGHPPYRSLRVPAGLRELPLLERLGWQVIEEPEGRESPQPNMDTLTLRRMPR